VHWKLTIDVLHTELDDLELLKLVGIDRWVSIPGVASIVYWAKSVFGTTLIRLLYSNASYFAFSAIVFRMTAGDAANLLPIWAWLMPWLESVNSALTTCNRNRIPAFAHCGPNLAQKG